MEIGLLPGVLGQKRSFFRNAQPETAGGTRQIERPMRAANLLPEGRPGAVGDGSGVCLAAPVVGPMIDMRRDTVARLVRVDDHRVRPHVGRQQPFLVDERFYKPVEYRRERRDQAALAGPGAVEIEEAAVPAIARRIGPVGFGAAAVETSVEMACGGLRREASRVENKARRSGRPVPEPLRAGGRPTQAKPERELTHMMDSRRLPWE